MSLLQTPVKFGGDMAGGVQPHSSVPGVQPGQTDTDAELDFLSLSLTHCLSLCLSLWSCCHGYLKPSSGLSLRDRTYWLRTD